MISLQPLPAKLAWSWVPCPRFAGIFFRIEDACPRSVGVAPRRPLALAVLLLVFAHAACLAGPKKAAEADKTAGSVAELVRQLDSDDFTVREQACRRLSELSDRTANRSGLQAELRRAWALPELSTEARSLLQPICERLRCFEQAPQADSAEIDRRIGELDSSAFNRRESAAIELESLARSMPQAWMLSERLKHGLDRTGVSLDARRRMIALWSQARGTWLLAPAGGIQMPEVTPRQIDDWIARALGDGAAAGSSTSAVAEQAQADNAQRQLLDLLARDDCVPRVKQALEKRLEAETDEPQRARITALLDWTRPAMVAEFWQGSVHTSIQHLLVGVPSHPERAMRASYFDRCDDEKAHCVSGNSLSPGDWPVGVFFPHPLNLDSMFHLVNLPTPRRRMAYEYEVKRDQRQRLAELSDATLRKLLAAKRSLDERELLMLRFLEPHAVSRFAGRYLTAVADEPILGLISADTTMDLRMFGSRHGYLCGLLAERGTHEAAPGLLRVCQNDKLLAPTDESPFRLPWIAALAIARRDPWPGVDAWLEGLVTRSETLTTNGICQGQLGGTAAGILLERHGLSPEAFGLEATGDESLLDSMRFTAYQFRSPEQRQRMLAWWPGFKRHLTARLHRSS